MVVQRIWDVFLISRCTLNSLSYKGQKEQRCFHSHQGDMLIAVIASSAFKSMPVISKCPRTEVNQVVILNLQHLLKREVGVGV